MLDQAQHSGSFGGAIPDALIGPRPDLASLHDDAGDVAVPGLRALRLGGAGSPKTSSERGRRGRRPRDDRHGFARRSAAVRAGDLGARHRRPTDRRFLEPDRSRRAGAQVSLRLAPGDDPRPPNATLDRPPVHAARGACRWRSRRDEAGQGYLVDAAPPASGPHARRSREAYGADVVEMGLRRLDPARAVARPDLPGRRADLGRRDERSNTHSVDESVDLDELERMALAEALFIRNLARAASVRCRRSTTCSSGWTDAPPDARHGRRAPLLPRDLPADDAGREARDRARWVRRRPTGPNGGTSSSRRSTSTRSTTWTAGRPAPGPWQRAFDAAAPRRACRRSVTCCWG